MVRKYFGFILILLIGIIPLFDLFHPGLPITHDGQDHVARVANFYQSLSEGNLIPRWAANLNWGYGHPILMFLYPLPSYVASLFHFLGFSLIDSVKIVSGLAFIASGIAMYLWVRNFLGEIPALIGSTLYLFAPYRFVDLYVRGAIGEHVAFVFPPLILYFLLKLSKKYSYWFILGGSLSLVGLLLSHNAVSIMFLPFILFYGVHLIITSRSKIFLIYQYTSILVIGLGTSSFFWLPAFFEGKYTLRDIVTSGEEYASRFVEFRQLIYGFWNYGGTGEFTVQIGVVQLIGVVLSLFLLFRSTVRGGPKGLLGGVRLLYLFTFLYFLGSIFLMLKESDFIWRTFTTLQKFQFPWRFLSATVFTTAILGGFLISTADKKYKLFLVLSFLFLVIYFNKDYWHAKDYLYKPDDFFEKVYYGTTDTGESSPRWSVRFMEKEPKAYAEIIEGKADIKELFRKSTDHQYQIISNSEKVRIRENTLYFPGWRVFVDSKEVPIEFQDPNNRGLITFYVGKGKHIVDVRFGETKLRKVANLISLASLISLLPLSFIVTRIQKI